MAIPLVGTSVTVGSGLRPRLAWAEGLTGEIVADRRHPFDLAHTPTPPLATAGAAGNVDVGAHSWVVVFMVSSVAYRLSAASAVLTIASAAKKVNLTVPVGPSDVTARKVYRTVAGDVGDYKLVGTISDNTTTAFEDNIADASLGTAVSRLEKVGADPKSIVVKVARPTGGQTRYHFLTLPVDAVS